VGRRFNGPRRERALLLLLLLLLLPFFVLWSWTRLTRRQATRTRWWCPGPTDKESTRCGRISIACLSGTLGTMCFRHCSHVINTNPGSRRSRVTTRLSTISRLHVRSARRSTAHLSPTLSRPLLRPRPQPRRRRSLPRPLPVLRSRTRHRRQQGGVGHHRQVCLVRSVSPRGLRCCVLGPISSGESVFWVAARSKDCLFCYGMVD
jgi:hypothetical protein